LFGYVMMSEGTRLNAAAQLKALGVLYVSLPTHFAANAHCSENPSIQQWQSWLLLTRVSTILVLFH
jgi:hypothetical protein